jgi:peroxiredoxin
MRLLLPFLLVASAAFCQQQTPRPAPDFTIHMLDGSNLRLSSYKGKTVVLAFLNTGCTHCQHFAQELSGFEKEYGPKGVQVLGVVFDNGAKARLQNFKDQYAKGFPVGYSDEATVLAWLKQPVEEGYFVPIVAFINRKGMIVSQHLGDDNLFQDPDGNIRRKLDQLTKR